MTAAIRVEGLGKCYQVRQGQERTSYRTLRESLSDMVRAPFRRRTEESGRDDFWALKDMSFAVQPGEVMGIIGRNGAGKSTLLKILSRITKPTKGRVHLNGRVGSLLEVGTGFHPELTGRENVYLNGSILGMSRKEIDRRFDEIVAFAEVEKFLDTPVKRYSSGMYVRLAFAVAAHLEPEILIVDEVLAVGDIAFQRKCMGRMREVGRKGCTVLFVSHNMPAVEALCSCGILLDQGGVVTQGDVSDVISEYRQRVMSADHRRNGTALDDARPYVERRVFRSATLLDDNGLPTQYIPLSAAFYLRLGLDAGEGIENPVIGVGIDDALGQRILTVYTPLSRQSIERLAGSCEVDCRISHLPLGPGDYSVKLAIAVAGGELDSVERALHFSVMDGDAFGEGRGHHRGVCVAPSVWNLRAGVSLAKGRVPPRQD